jgi:D-alanine transaminase
MSDTSLPPLPCYLNGEFSTLRDAKVSVLDRGFIFGDGVYEVVPAYAGRPFRFAEHMARLDRSLAELRIANPMRHEQWHALVLQLLAAYAKAMDKQLQQTDQMVYIQITRGVAMRDHVMPPGLTPTVFVTSNRMYIYPESARSEGVACVTADDFRWKKAHVKSTSLAGAVLARQISADVGATETVMFRDGFLSEAAASNLWVVKDGKLMGTPKDNLVLEGIRYGLFETLCRHSVRAAPDFPRRGVRGRRAAGVVGDQGGVAGDVAGRQAHWNGAPRPHLPRSVRRLPACQASLKTQ